MNSTPAGGAGRAIFFAIIMFILLGLAVGGSACALSVQHARAASEQVNSHWQFIAEKMWSAIGMVLTRDIAAKVIVLVGALVIGAFGALAYYYGVYFGFIDKDSRAAILRNLDGRPLAFAFFGGVIAGVFQLTEPVLVPIQAFVLGSTWPAVVTRLRAGQGGGLPSASELVDSPPRDIRPSKPLSELPDVQIELGPKP